MQKVNAENIHPIKNILGREKFLCLKKYLFLNHYLPTHCGHGSFGSGHGQTTFGSVGSLAS